jgi:hypothetical protein
MTFLCKTFVHRLSIVTAAILALTFATAAQVKTTTSTTEGASAKQVKVDRGEVESVSGNDLWVKMEDGQVRHFTVSPDAKVTVDGKELGIQDLKPGMKLERTITTTTTPRTVTTVQTVIGRVWAVNPPKTVILTLENGENQQFTVPEGQKFMINGQETDVFHLKKGMTVTASKTTEVPETVVQHQKEVAGTMPPPPELPPNTPVLIARVEVSHGPSAVVNAPSESPKPGAELPKTGSLVPLIGLLGALFASASLCLRLVRR